MKDSTKFIAVVSASTVLTLTIVLGYFAVMAAIAYKNCDLTVDQDKNVLVIGNSQPAQAFNDSILHNWKNVAVKAAYYNELAPPLDFILTKNQHIDTVVVGISCVAFSRFPNHAYMSRDIPQLGECILNILCDKDLIALNLGNPEFLKAFILNSPTIFYVNKPRLVHSFAPEHTHKLGLLIELFKKEKNANPANFSCNDWNFTIQYDGIKRIIDVCRQHGVACVFVDTPQYHIYDHVDGEYYRYFLSTLDPEIPIADYNNFEFPDTSYYEDVTHLNYLGAQYFSDHIRRNGLQTVPLGVYSTSPEFCP